MFLSANQPFMAAFWAKAERTQRPKLAIIGLLGFERPSAARAYGVLRRTGFIENKGTHSRTFMVYPKSALSAIQYWTFEVFTVECLTQVTGQFSAGCIARCLAH